MNTRAQILLAGLEMIHAFGLDRVAPRFIAGIGAILLSITYDRRNRMPFSQAAISRSRREFLDELIVGIRAAGAEIVSLDEAYRRLMERDISEGLSS